jgi:hypothetical protein
LASKGIQNKGRHKTVPVLYLRDSNSAARRRDAEMSGERRLRRDDETGGVSKPGGGGGAIRLQVKSRVFYKRDFTM